MISNQTQKSLIINQPFGLGDIIFVQNIINHFSKTRKIIFPVYDEYIWVKDYFLNDNVEYVKKSDFVIDYDNHIPTEDYLPLRFSTQLYRGLSKFDYSHDHTVMEDKYNYLNLNFKDWKNFTLLRNEKKESELCNLLGLHDNDYCLVNENFGSDAVGSGKISIPLSDIENKKIIKLQKINGFTMFDWCGVLEKCNEIHTMDTSFVWLVDYLNFNQKKFIYFRSNNTLGLKNILSNDWIFA